MPNVTMLIKVDTRANNNKFYELTELPNGGVRARWGRVGAVGQSQTYNYPGAFREKLNEKQRKGYVLFSGAQNDPAPSTPHALPTDRILESLFAKEKHTATATALVASLVRNNRHAITDATGGKITVNTSGAVTTALGPVTRNQVVEARTVLDALAAQMAGGTFTRHDRERYLTLIPQKVRDVTTTDWITGTWVQQQRDLLDALDTAVSMSSQDDGKDGAPDAIPFRHTLVELDTGSEEFAAIGKRFRESVNQNHVTASRKLLRVWKLTDSSRDAWEKHKASLKHHRTLWHGTTAGNVLSILRTGLICPPSSDSRYATSGRMFGDGVYFSDQSTKSLNYAAGFWNRDTGSGNPMMFLADVVMGREYRPTSYGSSSIPRAARTGKDEKGRPYNSIFVRAGACGVRNNEMIVWNTDQITLTYLCEFSS